MADMRIKNNNFTFSMNSFGGIVFEYWFKNSMVFYSGANKVFLNEKPRRYFWGHFRNPIIKQHLEKDNLPFFRFFQLTPPMGFSISCNPNFNPKKVPRYGRQ